MRLSMLNQFYSNLTKLNSSPDNFYLESGLIEWVSDIFIARGKLIDWLSEWVSERYIYWERLIDWLSKWVSEGQIYLLIEVDWLIE